jgi:transcriptional regulator with XRE-family HTH domain
MEIDELIADRLRLLRASRGWTLERLAEASGVSRGMVSKIERREASATAALLSKLANALDVPLSELLDRPRVPGAVSRKAERPRWQDPATGFVREIVSPPLTGSAVEIVEIDLPAGARVDYHLEAPASYRQHVLVLAGTLRIHQGEPVELHGGDAAFMDPSGHFAFENPQGRPCRYLIVMERRTPA